jgi:hypothetical protein
VLAGNKNLLLYVLLKTFLTKVLHVPHQGLYVASALCAGSIVNLIVVVLVQP